MVTSRRGYTLTEAMLVVAITSVLFSMGGTLLLQINRFFLLSRTRVELQRDARAALYLVNRTLRQASAQSIRIDRAASQPHYSRITFTKAQGSTVSFYQTGRQLFMTEGGRTRALSQNLRYLAFAFPRSDDMTIVSVAMTLEQSIYEGRTKALHMASEKVRVMNP